MCSANCSTSPEIPCPIIGSTQSTNSQNIVAYLLNPPLQQHYLLSINTVTATVTSPEEFENPRAHPPAQSLPLAIPPTLFYT